MKAMMVLFDSELQDEIFMLLKFANIKNYTQFKGLSGSSAQGKKDGTVAWPGSNEILLLIVNEDEKQNFIKVVRDYKAERELPPGLLVFDWKLEEVL